MSEIFLFWDLQEDTLEILGEDGEFYAYGEDSVAIDQGAAERLCRYWIKMDKIRDVHPLNTSERYEIFDPRKMDWVKFMGCDFKTFTEVCLQAGVNPDAIY